MRLMKMIVAIIHGGNVKNGLYISSFEHSKGKTSTKRQFISYICLFRHGSPANLPKGQTSEKVEFANFYLKGFSGKTFAEFDLFIEQHIILLAKVITLVFGILETYRQKVYVSPRVVQLCLNYLRER